MSVLDEGLAGPQVPQSFGDALTAMLWGNTVSWELFLQALQRWHPEEFGRYDDEHKQGLYRAFLYQSNLLSYRLGPSAETTSLELVLTYDPGICVNMLVPTERRLQTWQPTGIVSARFGFGEDGPETDETALVLLIAYHGLDSELVKGLYLAGGLSRVLDVYPQLGVFERVRDHFLIANAGFERVKSGEWERIIPVHRFERFLASVRATAMESFVL